jgi:hypothetical protein
LAIGQLTEVAGGSFYPSILAGAVSRSRTFRIIEFAGTSEKNKSEKP